MRDGDISIPETRSERWADRARHFYHRLLLPRLPHREETWEPSCLELLLTLLDDD